MSPPAAADDVTLVIEGMTCASCVRRVERSLSRVEGTHEAAVNLATGRAAVRGSAPVASLVRAIEHAGYHARIIEDEASETQARRAADHAARRRIVDIVLGAALTIPLLVLSMGFMDRFPGENVALLILAAPVWLYVGREFHRGALSAARHGVATMDTLVSLGSSVAFIASAWGLALQARPVLYFDTAAAIVTLIALGKYLEAVARDRAGTAIRSLARLGARSARVLSGGDEVEVPVAYVRVGDLVRVRPGERVPVDGEIDQGRAQIDESMLTGESAPVERGPGDEVIGASLNLDGLLTVRATRVGTDTALARITRLVERAQMAKAPAQRLADRISQVFVPAVLLLAATTFAGWLLTGHGSGDAMSAAVAVLVVACPCALGLATPAAIMAGTGRGAQNGILIKNGESLERLRRVTVVVLDKTGTITAGRPTVTSIFAASGDEARILRLAGAVEAGSEHPLGRAVFARAATEGPLPPVQDFKAIPGGGVSGSAGGHRVLVGSPRLLAAHGTVLDGLAGRAAEAAAAGSSTVLVAIDGQAVGLIAASDLPKETSAEAVRALHRMGIEVTMLTGDVWSAAESVARDVGIDRVVAEIGPEEKALEVRRLQEAGQIVAVAGDGINDAPALAQADAGIAMGTGTEVAMETADVTLVEGDIRRLAMAIRLARATARVIRQNLFWALFYNVILIPLAAFGVVSPILAAGAMAFSSVSVVGNALRLRRMSLLPSYEG